MEAKEEYFRLKDLWIKSKGLERENASKQLNAFMDTLSEEDKKLVTEAIADDFAHIHKAIDDSKQLRKKIEVRRQLEEILPFISVFKFAHDYFNESMGMKFMEKPPHSHLTNYVN